MRTSISNNPTPYPDLNEVLEQLVTGIQEILGSNFVGAYLQGSSAVGDFDEHSDVDFIIVIPEELTDEQVSLLQVMHGRIFELDSAWAQRLDGSYFPRAILKDYSQAGSKLWFLEYGTRELKRSDTCNTVVVRWTLREGGVRLAGPGPATLVDPIPVKVLRRNIFEAIAKGTAYYLANPECFNKRFYQSYIVLQWCRMLADLKNGCPGSKHAGAEWAKANLDPRWRGLIDRAWVGRPNPEVSVLEPPDPEDYKSTLEFVKYVMDLSNALYPSGIPIPRTPSV